MSIFKWQSLAVIALSLLNLSACLPIIKQVTQPLLSQAESQAELNTFAQNTEFRFGVLHNFTAEANAPKAYITINNHSLVALPAGESDWKMYFHFLYGINNTVFQGLTITHIKGDLFELAPTKDFKGLPKGQQLNISFSTGSWIISSSSFLPRAFITQTNLVPVIFANTDTENLASFVEPFITSEQQLHFGGAKPDAIPIATAATRYQDNLAINQTLVKPEAIALGIIPQPQKITRLAGNTNINEHWHIVSDTALNVETDYLQQALAAQSIKISASNNENKGESKAIVLQVTGQGAAESYQLQITTNKILIKGSDTAGVFYGIQSLLMLMPNSVNNSMVVPQVNILDAPRYSWRGMHYDMARNFHGKAVVLRLIEQMARYKLNKLHMHIADDEGWRLEIPGLPELTEIGANRCFDLTEQRCLLTQLGGGPKANTNGNGYFSTKDFIEILRYASARHIEIIPEIDMPGHSRAAIKSMEARYNKLLAVGQTAAEQYLLSEAGDKSEYLSVQYYNDNAVNVCLPSTYAFVDKIMQELQNLYREAGLSLANFHMGGDEVGKGAWTKSKACAALFEQGDKNVAAIADLKPYFVGKIAQLSQSRGLALSGWEDGLMLDSEHSITRAQIANKDVYAMVWDNIWEGGLAERAYRLANNNYHVVLAPATHFYFDHPYEANPDARGVYWATRYTSTAKIFNFMPDNYYANADKQKSGEPIASLASLLNHSLVMLNKPENISGMQGNVWSEIIRTPEILEQMIYPRLMVLAERAWHKATWESDQPNSSARQQDWILFNHILATKTLPQLAASESNFYLSPPGGIFKEGKLFANASYPELAIEYSLDQGVSWKNYTAPVTLVQKSVLLRTHLATVKSVATEVH